MEEQQNRKEVEQEVCNKAELKKRAKLEGARASAEARKCKLELKRQKNRDLKRLSRERAKLAKIQVVEKAVTNTGKKVCNTDELRKRKIEATKAFTEARKLNLQLKREKIRNRNRLYQERVKRDKIQVVEKAVANKFDKKDNSKVGQAKRGRISDDVKSTTDKTRSESPSIRDCLTKIVVDNECRLISPQNDPIVASVKTDFNTNKRSREEQDSKTRQEDPRKIKKMKMKAYRRQYHLTHYYRNRIEIVENELKLN